MTAEEKAQRVLREGRLTVTRVDDHAVVACCRGFSEGEVYWLGWSAQTNWRCTCPASTKFHRTCSHLRALQLVCVKPAQRPQLPEREGAAA